MTSFLSTQDNTVNTGAKPRGYVTPSFPSLYYPIPVRGAQAQFLYDPSDIVVFTLSWTLIFYAALHVTTALTAAVASGFTSGRKSGAWKVVWIVTPIWVFVGGAEACVSGACVGGLLAAVYSSGNFQMSTWIPFVWALINSLILILSSFAVQGGL